MKSLLIVCMLLSLAGCATSSSREGGAHGLTAQRSPHGVKATIDRFEAAAKARGLTVFARIDHAAGAVWLGYNDPRHLLHRHRGGECQPAVDNVAKALGALAAEALKR